MKNKKIVYLTRYNFYTEFGGDTVQVLKTKEVLEKKYNLEISIICDNGNLLDNIEYDILHVWGINASPVLNEIIKDTKRKNKKVVISSIYWSSSHPLYFKHVIFPFFKGNLFAILKYFVILFVHFILVPFSYMHPKYKKKSCHIFGCKKFKTFRKVSIKYADIIIPNSDEEGMLLCKDIDLEYNSVKHKFVSVPNAVDVEKLNIKCEKKILPDLSGFVIEAAGIEPLKNQVAVVKSLFTNPEIPIVFAGAVRDEKYFSYLKKLADKRGNVFFTGKIEENQLFDLYKRAKVHVLPSLRESPGLVTIEALMNRCQIVVSEEKFCPLKYYKFDKYGFICDPYDTKSIRDAILNAYNNPKNINLPKEYYEFFSYNNVADMTYQAYKKLFMQE